MIWKSHTIELYINGNSVDLEGDDSLNIRFNNVLMTPEKVNSSSGEYSFEFELPTTKKNNKVFDYANTLAKTNKFHQRYNAEVIADGTQIFTGTLVINSIKDNKYTCNLVAVKTYSLEEIFGDLTLNKIPWNIDFSGVTSINDYNQNSAEVKFPLISYGVFAKDPKHKDEVYSEYTSKFAFDKWNKWYVQSFFPSHNMMETVRKAFEWKGYQVWGDAFNDDTLKNIYMSINLADDQDPEYNLGNPAFGHVDISTSASFSGGGYMQELQFPYEHVQLRSLSSTEEHEYYNFDNVLIQDLLSTGVSANTTPSYMYQPNEHCIVIPQSGWYMIELTGNTTISAGTINAALHVTHENGYEWIYENETITKSLSAMTPVEIHLVRNYDDNIELIKGKHNIEYSNGSPSSTANTWLTCFPHEDPVAAKLPTKRNDLYIVNQTRMGGLRSSNSSSSSSSNGGTSASGNFSGYRGTTRGGTIDPTGGGRVYSEQKYGYMYRDFDDNPQYPELMCYDQAVSPSFICGISSYQGGVGAVMKNGYSWSKSTSTKNEVFAPVVGYDYVYRSTGTSQDPPHIVFEHTDFNKNIYKNAPFHACSADTTSSSGSVACCVWLEKNDVINLFSVSRAFFDKNGVIVPYSYDVSTQLKITAFSTRNQAALKSDNDFTYDSPTEFPVQLNLGNFLSSGTTIQSFIQGVADAFNLEIIQDGKTVRIDKREKYANGEVGVVDLDNRASNYDAESERINYPKSMQIAYKTNVDEWGFEQTVPLDKIDLEDWYKYGDSGFTKILLNDDSYVTNESNVNTIFSYTWYDTFTWTKVDEDHVEDSATTTTFDIPVISESTYMVDGYDYDESEQHDGYGLTQRLWFTPSMQPYVDSQMHSLPTYVWTDTYPQEKVYIYTPVNAWNGLNLSYKASEKSLLDYFNIKAELASNYVNLEVYLTPEEYKLLKSGGKVKFDSDLYNVVQIEGYNPSGNETTKLKLMKQT